MEEDLEINWEDEDGTRQPADDEEMLWTHQTLNQFELLIDTLGISTVMFLMSQEHEQIVSSWVKDKVDISNRTKQ
jgi:hypothetical protein